MKKIKHSAVFALSALSAALISHTATVYASDIEIYKAPTTGGATLQLVLDMSSSMVQPAKGASGGNGDPINTDYGISCSNSAPRSKNTAESNNLDGHAYVLEQTRSFITLSGITKQYKFDGRFCNVAKSSVDDWAKTTASASNKKKAALIKVSCDLVGTSYYRCPDRLTSLKHSFFDLILGTEDTPALPATASIGFVTFPTNVHQSILSLTDPAKNPANLNDTSWNPNDEKNKDTLLSAIAPLSVANGTHIARKYADGAKILIDHISTAEQSCAGYGVYFLTDGASYQDNRDTAASTITPYLRSPATISSTCVGKDSQFDLTNSPKSWPCVESIATQLQQNAIKKGANNINTEIKTAIVGFGSEFSFKDTNGNSIEFDSTLSATAAAAKFTDPVQKAAVKAAVAGKGGWYSADNTADVVNSVQEFVKSIKVPIPAITTGTATIPQDPLNAVAVQPYAYFPQFKPQPSETFQLWSGNLKKFKVVNSVLEDKDGLKVFNDTNGQLNTATKDLWVKNIASSETELLALGGMLSKLKLKGTATGFNRKVYTNTNSTISPIVDENFIKANLGTRKYLLGLLGYDLTETDLNVITNTTSLTMLSPSKTLRNIGAIMHSTPILLTQEGKVTSSSGIDTTARKDYLLFGTTQGALHVVRAGTESDTGTSYNGGEEEFVFVPQETLTNQPRALLNENESGTNGMNQLYYGVDGPWVAHTEYVYNSTDDKFYVKDDTKLGKQWVYGGMRMGGRSYYALDLTDMSVPTIKFRIDPTTSTVYTSAKKQDGTNITPYSYSHLAKMGESWSKPVITNVQWEGKRRLVMFVGGGYDRTGGSDGKGYETFNYDQTSGVGAGVFMFDANTGEPLWSTYESATKGDGDDLKYSIVSQIKTIDRDGDGDVDHLYFGDLGGQVFRVDLNSSHPVLNISSTATPSQQASAIAASKASFANNIIRILDVHKANGLSPRFYEVPGFSIYNGTSGIYAVVSIGSGNRSNPLLGKIVNNNYIVSGETAALNASLPNDAIYNLFDTDVVKKDILSTYTYVLRDTTPSALAIVNDTNRELGVKPTATTSNPNPQPANKIDFTGKKGWYYEFTSSTGRKAVEKVQGDIIVVDNDLYVTTFDAEAVGTTEACGAGIYGGSEAHRFCMPYGQCPNGETVAQNTLNLGKGILGITLGGGTDGSANTRSIVAPINSRNPASNKLLAALYKSEIKLTPLSWYEKN